MLKGIGFVLLGLTLFAACNDQETFVPKPSTFLELNLPERSYENYTDRCGYSFNKPSYFKFNDVAGSECNRDIELSTLNGVLHLSRMDMDTTLDAYVNYSIDKVGEHKVMATAIYDTSFVRSDAKVFGTLFELQGNVASPFQFYLTDSTTRFLSGVLYFNSRPNYDSILPTLEFVKQDLYEFMKTLEWD